MSTYYMECKVVPTALNPHFNEVKGAYAHCWITEDTPQTSHAKIKFFLEKTHWEITEIERSPIKVTISDLQGKDLGTKHFEKAQNEGISIALVATARDENSSPKQFLQKTVNDFNLNELEHQKRTLKNSKRCLHYNSGSECDYFINAHSIQQNGSLSIIEENGLVYTVSKNMSDFKSNNGQIILTKQGIKKQVSTFFGFCKKHDNELFEQIDNYLLTPTSEQVALYAYRSICKELFVKENSYNLFNNQTHHQNKNPAISKLINSIASGTKLGLDNLEKQKKTYDCMLKKQSYQDMRYVLFRTQQKPNIVFSGLIYPEFDFMGRLLQEIDDPKTKSNLITFCSAKLDNGWGFLFAWHNSSSSICTEFMESLATMTHENEKVQEYLFRLVISNCENIAIAPSWWESLDSIKQRKIEKRMSTMADLFSQTNPEYLRKGLEGICVWEFKDVISVME